MKINEVPQAESPKNAPLNNEVPQAESPKNVPLKRVRRAVSKALLGATLTAGGPAACSVEAADYGIMMDTQFGYSPFMNFKLNKVEALPENERGREFDSPESMLGPDESNDDEVSRHFKGHLSKFLGPMKDTLGIDLVALNDAANREGKRILELRDLFPRSLDADESRIQEIVDGLEEVLAAESDNYRVYPPAFDEEVRMLKYIDFDKDGVRHRIYKSKALGTPGYSIAVEREGDDRSIHLGFSHNKEDKRDSGLLFAKKLDFKYDESASYDKNRETMQELSRGWNSGLDEHWAFAGLTAGGTFFLRKGDGIHFENEADGVSADVTDSASLRDFLRENQDGEIFKLNHVFPEALTNDMDNDTWVEIMTQLPKNDPKAYIRFYSNFVGHISEEANEDEMPGAFESPEHTLRSHVADCDNYAMLNGLWAKLNGFSGELIQILNKDNTEGHTLIEVFGDDGKKLLFSNDDLRRNMSVDEYVRGLDEYEKGYTITGSNPF